MIRTPRAALAAASGLVMLASAVGCGSGNAAGVPPASITHADELAKGCDLMTFSDPRLTPMAFQVALYSELATNGTTVCETLSKIQGAVSASGASESAALDLAQEAGLLEIFLQGVSLAEDTDCATLTHLADAIEAGLPQCEQAGRRPPTRPRPRPVTMPRPPSNNPPPFTF